MNSEALQSLANLIRSQRVAALGTSRAGAPLVSMVLYAAARDFTALYIHVSALAQHTRNLFDHRRAGVMIAQPDSGKGDPQTLARVSISAEASVIASDSPRYAEVRSHYVDRFPFAARNFQLGDFHLFEIRPGQARFVAGFGQIFDLGIEDFRAAATLVE